MDPISTRELVLLVVAIGSAVISVSLKMKERHKNSEPSLLAGLKKAIKSRPRKLLGNFKIEGRKLPKRTRFPFLEDDPNEKGWLDEQKPVQTSTVRVSVTKKAAKKTRPQNNPVGRIRRPRSSKKPR